MTQLPGCMNLARISKIMLIRTNELLVHSISRFPIATFLSPACVFYPLPVPLPRQPISVPRLRQPISVLRQPMSIIEQPISVPRLLPPIFIFVLHSLVSFSIPGSRTLSSFHQDRFLLPAVSDLFPGKPAFSCHDRQLSTEQKKK